LRSYILPRFAQLPIIRSRNRIHNPAINQRRNAEHLLAQRVSPSSEIEKQVGFGWEP
jgi:hypothetical protein